MKKYQLILTCLFIFSCFSLIAQDKPAYRLYNAKGKKVSYKKMLKKLRQADIVLFGESHNNPICHWLELEVAQSLKEKNQLTIGMEMFERDNQIILTQYLTNEIDRRALDTLARLWNNYQTDYEPIIAFAKANYVPVIATNIPRRYASMVYRGGFEALDKLPKVEKEWIAPLPIPYDKELPGYKKMLEMMGGSHGGENLPKAQAIKDATMAYAILANFEKGETFLHVHGSYHSDNYEGILWYLKKNEPNLTYYTISTVAQESIGQLKKEHIGQADFIICVPENMTKTY